MKWVLSAVLILGYLLLVTFVDSSKPDAQFGLLPYYNELQTIYHYSPILLVTTLILLFKKELGSLFNNKGN